jgi:hypothetical protein
MSGLQSQTASRNDGTSTPSYKSFFFALNQRMFWEVAQNDEKQPLPQAVRPLRLRRMHQVFLTKKAEKKTSLRKQI